MTVAAHGGDIYQNQITYDFSDWNGILRSNVTVHI